MAEPAVNGFLDRHHFLLHRLHSLSGILPIGAFLLFHLITNASVVWGLLLGREKYGHAGVETFQHEVNFIHSLPALALIEWGVLFIPIFFHAALGIVFARSGALNLVRYSYQGNWRYTLQRITGYIGVLFIFMHLTSLRFGWTYWGLMPTFVADNAASSTAAHFQSGAMGLLMAVFYLICVTALVYHFANGMWTAAITWGLTVTVEAQARWGYICAGLGLTLAAASVAAIIGFSTLDVELARSVERQMLEGAGGGHTAASVMDTGPAMVEAEPDQSGPEDGG